MFKSINFRVSHSCKCVCFCLAFLSMLFVGHPGFASAQGMRGQVTATNPSMVTATSVQMAAAKSDRVTMMIQNNSAANICCSLTGAVLTSIIPSAANPCFTINAGGSYTSPANFITTQAVTCYQASGGTIDTVYFHQG